MPYIYCILRVNSHLDTMPKPLHFQQVFTNTAMDYFCRLGGSGTWAVPNYDDWHPAALTIVVGLKHFNAISEAEYSTAKAVLPSELFQKCDKLADRVLLSFKKTEERLGQPREILSVEQNDLTRYLREQADPNNRSTRHPEARARYYTKIVENLERLFLVMKELPPLEEQIRGFRFRHKAY